MATFFITSSLIVIAVLIIRFTFKNKTSFLILYPLWGIVLLRLLIPVTIIESRASIMNFIYALNNKEIPSPAKKPVQEPEYNTTINNNSKISGSNQQKDSSGQIEQEITKDKNINNNVIQNKDSGRNEETTLKKFKETDNIIQENNPAHPLIKPAIIIWISGSAIFFIIIIISNAIFYKRLKKSRKHIYTDNKGINIFASEIINTPCIAGILYPSVYLPPDTITNNRILNPDNIQDKYLKQVLAHEYIHIRHKDNIWALMRTICLSIYWFDPFVWAAAFYSKQDSELACDAAVLKNCTNIEKYNYGKMLLTMSQKENKNHFCIKASMTGSKNNLKERINMISNSGQRKFKKYHAILITAATIILAGCGMTKEKIPVEKTHENSPDNTVNIAEKTKIPGETPVTASGNGINTAKTSNDIQTNKKDKIFKTEKIFQDFINNKIKSCPEWSKWKGGTKDLYFSIQYTTDNSPCLLVTTDVITDTNETINAFVYYYDKDTENIRLLTYLASNGTADPIKIKKGKFVITTHHSLRIYHWAEDKTEISADEIYGYFMDKEKYSYSFFKWETPFNSQKLQLDARKSYTKDEIDTYASFTSDDKNFPKNKATSLYKLYSDANPVPFYKNTEENWNQFYTDGGFKSTIHRIIWHGNYDDGFNNNITDIVKELSYQDFINAEEESSIQINGSRLSYSGKFNDEEVLFFLNHGYTLRAFILRTGQEEYASYDVYALDSSKWNQEDIFRDLASSSDSPDIFIKLRKSKLARADFDNDGETEIAFYITDNPYTLDGHKTLYMFDKKIYENGYKEYKLYSYDKDDYRYFAEQACINFDNAYSTEQAKQAGESNYFENIKNKPDSRGYKYKSRKNIIPGDEISGYNYIITDEKYKNNYEFGSKNNYDITLEDDKTDIKIRIGITYNQEGTTQKHNAELSATVQYKGNGKFILKSPYSLKNTD